MSDLTDKQQKISMPKKKPRGKPFEKGKVANPAGRPKKGDAWADIITELIEKEKPVSKMTYREVIVRKAIDLAALGDSRAIAFLANRESGMPRQAMEIKAVVSKDEIVEIGFDEE